MVKREGLDFFSEKKLFSKLPLVRGVDHLLSALVLGMKALNFSANQSLEEEKSLKLLDHGPYLYLRPLLRHLPLLSGPSLFDKWLRFAIPMVSTSGILFNLVDGMIRLMIFLAYLWAISFLKEIRGIFEYHGAEHKSIFAFESGEALSGRSGKELQLSPSQMRNELSSHRHGGEHFGVCPLPHQLAFGYKMASRVVFIPLIAGLAYEIIRFADRKAGEQEHAIFHQARSLAPTADRS